MFCLRKFLLVIFLMVAVVSCRGEDNQGDIDPELLDFIEAPDPDRFNLFLNPDLGTANASASEIECIGEGCAYYRSIDPDNTRDTLDKWLGANQFSQDISNPIGEFCSTNTLCCIGTNVGNSELDQQCPVVMAQASFRDTRDLGYGRDMYMRHDRVGGDIAVVVRNFKFDQDLGLPEGLPYGPQNLEALIQDFHPAQFSVSAIEFSAFPGNEQALKFAKFYTFDGVNDFPDGRGPRLLRTDIPERGTMVEMPNACISCHGGRGRSVIEEDGRLGPVLHDGIAGDVQAHLQIVDPTTLQFANASPYTREFQEPFIRAMNNAVLHSYVQYDDSNRPDGPSSSYWDPQHAIEFLKSRYNTAEDTEDGHCGSSNDSNPFDCLLGEFKSEFTVEDTPVGWSDPELSIAYSNLISPNCLSCHLLRGSYASEGVSFHSSGLFEEYADRIDDLVFARGLMPSGFWNYREFWDLKNPLPLADVLGLPASTVGVIQDDDKVGVEPPGRPIARISAPPVVQPGSTIVLSAAGSAFADQFVWSVTPESAAVVSEPNSLTTELLINDALEGPFNINLMVRDSSFTCAAVDSAENTEGCVDTDTATSTPSIAAEPVSTANDFFVAGGVGEILMESGCLGCHSGAAPLPGIPVLFCSDETNAEVLYRSILNRVNVGNPLDSLLLRKPTNGAFSLGSDLDSTVIDGYHGGGLVLGSDNQEEIATILNWINAGANPDSAAAEIPAGFFSCIDTTPQAIGDEFTLSASVAAGQGEFVLLDVIANDVDPDGGTLSIILQSNTSELGSMISVEGNQVRYLPVSMIDMTDSFTYSLLDNVGAESGIATVTLRPPDVVVNPPQMLSTEVGRNLAMQQCSVCHDTGVLDAPISNDIAVWNSLFDASGGIDGLLNNTLNGIGDMPAFGGMGFSDSDLVDAILYLAGRRGDGG